MTDCNNTQQAIELRIINYMEAVSAENGRRRFLAGAKVLSVLAASQPVCQQELADSMGIRLQSLVQTIEVLEKNGFVEKERSTVDKRKVLLHITKSGQTALKGHESRLDFCRRVLAPLSEEEKTVLEDMLLRIFAEATMGEKTNE